MERAYSVSEVAQMTGIKESTLRNWEREFQDYLKISRDRQGARIYTEYDIAKLQRISLMRSKGLSIGAIREVLQRFQVDDVVEEVAITKEFISLHNQPPSVQVLRKIIREELKELLQEQTRVIETRLERHKIVWWKFWK